ncbi:hypothetical protein R1sor_017395 [Riccia sorocarpa]|uniref:Uncharacterized protein n=1 Tax=Riccia sorocarpa TaxID=122646 RepID=A0ABD3I6R3_9MARC
MDLRPGPLLRQTIENVMRDKDEGEEKAAPPPKQPHGPKQRFSSKKEEEEDVTEPRPVRPGMFMYTVTKVMDGMYQSNAASGVTVQQLEWVSLQLESQAPPEESTTDQTAGLDAVGRKLQQKHNSIHRTCKHQSADRLVSTTITLPSIKADRLVSTTIALPSTKAQTTSLAPPSPIPTAATE